jgi:hypothetical protein
MVDVGMIAAVALAFGAFAGGVALAGPLIVVIAVPGARVTGFPQPPVVKTAESNLGTAPPKAADALRRIVEG